MSRPKLRAYVVGICLLIAPLVVPIAGRAADPEVITVFAAASLTDALSQAAKAYRNEGGPEVRFSFAASSALARQIEAGAPADIYASANEEWMDYLAGKNAIEASSRVSPLGNSLVMIAPADSTLDHVTIAPDFDITGLIGKDNKLVTGDPDSVPVGIYAKKALEHLGVWDKAEPMVARAESVRAALALVERGEAPLGIVYGTDAMASDKVKVVGTFPPDSYPAISYPFAIVAGKDTPEVRKLFDYLTGGAAASVYQRDGFTWRGPTG
ncbi:MAG: molybdate ABC transporter substrate-binding protein [Rhodospirillales bacterium]|nr:molybdate ABC transporter substrate-binding protein [Rhodospirillales bacterium]